jgi:hypothetical protein
MSENSEFSIQYVMKHMVSIEDGKHPSRQTAIGMIRRALEIANSPYSSPEQFFWAVEVYPEVLERFYPSRLPHGNL